MRARFVVLMVAALGPGVLVPRAQAQESASEVRVSFPDPPRWAGQAAALVSGETTIDFRSDPATCAAAGRCGLEGSVTWKPAAEATYVATEDGETPRTTASVFSNDGDGDVVTTTVRRETAGGPRVCTVRRTPGAQLWATGTARATRLALVGRTSDWPSTACPGPAGTDLLGAVPVATLDLAALRRGARTLDLGGEHPFTAAGLTGTLRSSVVVRVGRVREIRSRERAGSRAGTALRRVTSRFAVERVDGQVTYDVSARTGACAPLDACGALGTTVVRPRARAGTVELVAQGLARVGGRELRAAVGLLPGRASAGAQSTGSGFWNDRGSVSAELLREGAGAPCRDVAPLRFGHLDIEIRGSRAVVSLIPQAALTTRCGGPVLEDGDFAIARTVVPLRTFGRRRIVLRLRGTSRLAPDGYRAGAKADVRIVLRRTAVREERFRVPEGSAGPI